VDDVSELTRETWDAVFKKTIYEFFNLLSYLRQKNENLKNSIEKWKNQII